MSTLKNFKKKKCPLRLCKCQDRDGHVLYFPLWRQCHVHSTPNIECSPYGHDYEG